GLSRFLVVRIQGDVLVARRLNALERAVQGEVDVGERGAADLEPGGRFLLLRKCLSQGDPGKSRRAQLEKSPPVDLHHFLSSAFRSGCSSNFRKKISKPSHWSRMR